MAEHTLVDLDALRAELENLRLREPKPHIRVDPNDSRRLAERQARARRAAEHEPQKPAAPAVEPTTNHDADRLLAARLRSGG